MERTFRGIRVDGERITYRDADHPLLGARASVKTPAAVRRDTSAGRLLLDEASRALIDDRRATKGLFLVVDGEGFVMVVPVPIRKGSDARTFASRLNTATNRLALANPQTPRSEVSTMAERYSVGSGTRVSPPKFDSAESMIPATSELPTTYSAGSLAQAASRSSARASAPSTDAAGWYPDPTGRFIHRYWDGRSWTEHVDRNGMRSRDPIARRTSGAGGRGALSRAAQAGSLTEAIASVFGA